MIYNILENRRASNVGELRRALDGIPDDTPLECDMAEAIEMHLLREKGQEDGAIDMIDICGYDPMDDEP